MKICFIGSGMERELTRLHGIDVQAIVRVVRDHFDTLVFGGSNVGLMESFASSFASSGGQVISVVPRWLDGLDQVFEGCDPVFCEDLAERKKLMFEETDAILCYPGGIGTWDELFDLLARRSIESAVHEKPPCPPVYLYNWEKFYAPLLLQIETALEVGLIHPDAVAMIRPFESAEALMEMLRAQRESACRVGDGESVMRSV
jgi:uncharacterized protein (TIGR00730 family)